MLITGSRLIDTPIMGLQTGSELARTRQAVIDPQTLQIVAYEAAGPLLSVHPALLRIDDVREFSDIGLIIDSNDEFVSPDDVLKLRDVYDLHFNPIGMTVIDERKRKLGKVDGYTIDTTAFSIQQLSVKRPIWKSLNDTQLLIHRTQITEINDKYIVVHSRAEIPEPMLESVRSGYVNPFRKKSQAEQADLSRR
jgi:sporulation protein YlmC with PRC-barrel domain